MMKTIGFNVNEQTLSRTDGVFEYASNIVEYIEADFTFGSGWDNLDVIRAMWEGSGHIVATIVEDGKVIVPPEVLTHTGPVKVNLAGSDFEYGELVDRITTEPIVCLIVTKTALVDDEYVPTPSEFEQFVSRVEEAASKVDGAEEAAERAEDAADRAEDAAESAIKVGNMSVSAETLEPGSDATVTKTDDPATHGFHLEFGIPAGVKGDKGNKGDTGETGNGIASVKLNADYTLTITFTDGTSVTTESIRGEQGPQGIQGIQGIQGETGNGIASISKTGTSGLVDTYTITFTDGTTTTFTVTNGEKGDKGDTGDIGQTGATGTTYTPAVSNAGVISWTNDGQKPNPQSVDIVAAVLAALPTWTGGAY